MSRSLLPWAFKRRKVVTAERTSLPEDSAYKFEAWADKTDERLLGGVSRQYQSDVGCARYAGIRKRRESRVGDTDHEIFGKEKGAEKGVPIDRC